MSKERTVKEYMVEKQAQLTKVLDALDQLNELALTPAQIAAGQHARSTTRVISDMSGLAYGPCRFRLGQLRSGGHIDGEFLGDAGLVLWGGLRTDPSNEKARAMCARLVAA